MTRRDEPYGTARSAVVKIVVSLIRHRSWSVALVGLIAFAASAATGMILGIPEPRVHDEFSYLLAADTFARGRLTNPPHPLWIHFESFHVIHEPTYMSKYPPAQGLALAAGQLVAGEPIVGVWMSFGVMCAAICWMLHAWLPARWATFGAFLAVINPILGISGYWAQTYWGGAVPATGGALVLGGLRRLLQRPGVFAAFATGVGLVILANSRPYEGLLLALPAAFFLLRGIVGKERPRCRWSIIVLPILGVLTLAGLAMSTYNLRVTGHPLRMPYTAHTEAYGLVPLFLWQEAPRPPQYRHHEIQAAHESYDLAVYTTRRSTTGFVVDNLTNLSDLALFAVNVYAFPLIRMLPFVLVWMRRDLWGRRAAVFCGILTTGLLVETYCYPHYAAPVYAFQYFFVVMAIRLWRSKDRSAGAFAAYVTPLLALTLLGARLGGLVREDGTSWHLERARILRRLEAEEGQHLVVVKYGRNHWPHAEWVFNEADIDGAKVVWARSMDESRNRVLLDYFGGRRFWLLEVDPDNWPPKLEPYLRDEREVARR